MYKDILLAPLLTSQCFHPTYGASRIDGIFPLCNYFKMATLQSSPPNISCPKEISDLDSAKNSSLPMCHLHSINSSIAPSIV